MQGGYSPWHVIIFRQLMAGPIEKHNADEINETGVFSSACERIISGSETA
jgi:hypothetical protein